MDHALNSDHNTTSESAPAPAPRFSVIMPAHDAEAFLDAAILAIEHQTFDDWELIVVDDASRDASATIAQRHAAADPRIRIISHTQNKGAAAARNTGMDAARGRYIWFVDADDSFDTRILEQVDAEISGSDAQIVMFGRVEEYLASDHSLQYRNDIPMEPFASDDPAAWHARIIDIERQTNFGYVTSKVYEAVFLRERGVRFEDMLLNEDFVFNVHAFRDATRIAALPGVPYVYRKVEGSSVTNANAYSAEEYYELHHMRIAMMRDLLIGWGVFDERARGILGALYARYVMSTLERMHSDGRQRGKATKLAWVCEIMRDPLYAELIPHAQPKDSRFLRAGVKVLQSGNAQRCLMLGKAIACARKYGYKAFTKARSER